MARTGHAGGAPRQQGTVGRLVAHPMPVIRRADASGPSGPLESHDDLDMRSLREEIQGPQMCHTVASDQ